MLVSEWEVGVVNVDAGMRGECRQETDWKVSLDFLSKFEDEVAWHRNYQHQNERSTLELSTLEWEVGIDVGKRHWIFGFVREIQASWDTEYSATILKGKEAGACDSMCVYLVSVMYNMWRGRLLVEGCLYAKNSRTD